MRSLGRRGLDVVALTYNASEPGLASKYVTERSICPHTADRAAFVGHLLDNADRWGGALILDTNDHYATVLSQHHAVLSEHYRLVVPEWEVARHFIEKDLTYALADRCGVGHPRIFSPADLDELDAVLADVALPAMVKPVRSHEFYAHFKTKLFTAESAAELRRHFVAAHEAGMPVVVAEIVPGSDYKTLERVSMYVDSTGDVRTELYNTKLRQTPPMFGMNKVSVTTPVYDEVRAASIELLQAVGFRGPAGIEFKRDLRDGSLKLIEVNVRLLADTQLSIAAGIDLPWIIYQDLVLDHRDPPPTAEPGVYYVHLLTDVFEFFTRERGRIRHLGRFLEPYRARRRTYAYLSRDDPRPFIGEATMRLRRLGRKVVRLARRR
jgi:D-aspartate ligase